MGSLSSCSSPLGSKFTANSNNFKIDNLGRRSRSPSRLYKSPVYAGTLSMKGSQQPEPSKRNKSPDVSRRVIAQAPPQEANTFVGRQTQPRRKSAGIDSDPGSESDSEDSYARGVSNSGFQPNLDISASVLSEEPSAHETLELAPLLSSSTKKESSAYGVSKSGSQPTNSDISASILSDEPSAHETLELTPLPSTSPLSSPAMRAAMLDALELEAARTLGPLVAAPLQGEAWGPAQAARGGAILPPQPTRPPALVGTAVIKKPKEEAGNVKPTSDKQKENASLSTKDGMVGAGAVAAVVGSIAALAAITDVGLAEQVGVLLGVGLVGQRVAVSPKARSQVRNLLGAMGSLGSALSDRLGKFKSEQNLRQTIEQLIDEALRDARTNTNSTDFKTQLSRKIMLEVADWRPSEDSDARVVDLEARLEEADALADTLGGRLKSAEAALKSQLEAQEDITTQGRVVKEAFHALEDKERERAELEGQVSDLNATQFQLTREVETLQDSLQDSQKSLHEAKKKVVKAQEEAALTLNQKASLLEERAEFVREKNQAASQALKAEAQAEQLASKVVLHKSMRRVAEKEKEAAVLAREDALQKMARMRAELEQLRAATAKLKSLDHTQAHQETKSEPAPTPMDVAPTPVDVTPTPMDVTLAPVVITPEVFKMEESQAETVEAPQPTEYEGLGPTEVESERLKPVLPVLSKMSESELVDECEERNLPTVGSLPELRVRLRIARKVEENAIEAAAKRLAV